MPGYTFSVTAPHLVHCHDGYYLWATQQDHFDEFSIPAYVRLDDRIGVAHGKLVYYGQSYESESDSEGEIAGNKLRGEFSMNAVSVELNKEGTTLTAILNVNGKEVSSTLDLNEILGCNDGEFTWA